MLLSFFKAKRVEITPKRVLLKYVMDNNRQNDNEPITCLIIQPYGCSTTLTNHVVLYHVILSSAFCAQISGQQEGYQVS